MSKLPGYELYGTESVFVCADQSLLRYQKLVESLRGLVIHASGQPTVYACITGSSTLAGLGCYSGDVDIYAWINCQRCSDADMKQLSVATSASIATALLEGHNDAKLISIEWSGPSEHHQIRYPTLVHAVRDGSLLDRLKRGVAEAPRLVFSLIYTAGDSLKHVDLSVVTGSTTDGQWRVPTKLPAWPQTICFSGRDAAFFARLDSVKSILGDRHLAPYDHAPYLAYDATLRSVYAEKIAEENWLSAIKMMAYLAAYEKRRDDATYLGAFLSGSSSELYSLSKELSMLIVAGYLHLLDDITWRKCMASALRRARVVFRRIDVDAPLVRGTMENKDVHSRDIVALINQMNGIVSDSSQRYLERVKTETGLATLMVND